ncbi:hypothetical protein NDU88_003624 [Pleurodeles waltl]|uniref:Uncharacterized protein n=1 Tax=Pleurodeles waltl TaxID=8319 RepID=A0AAV7UCL5_PLEWA|nr:hypothetical protein NDU88_003624 [Pleurodeles waltl]
MPLVCQRQARLHLPKPGPHPAPQTRVFTSSASLMPALYRHSTQNIISLPPSRIQAHPLRFFLQRLLQVPPQGSAPSSDIHHKCLVLNTSLHVSHAVEVWDLLDSTASDFDFLTETSITPTAAPDIATAIPDNYKIIHKDRANQPGGSIAIIYKNNLRLTTTIKSQSTHEHLHFQFHTNPNTFLHGILIYRPPDLDPSSAKTSLTSLHPNTHLLRLHPTR